MRSLTTELENACGIQYTCVTQSSNNGDMLRPIINRLIEHLSFKQNNSQCPC